MSVCHLVGRSSTLVQTEISEQLLDALLWNLVQTFMVLRASIPLTFPVVPRIGGAI